jgi:hypothetical protein
VTLRARWVTLRARWVTLRARRVPLRARWVTLRAHRVTLTVQISAVSVFYETFAYRLNEETGIIDYDKMDEVAAVVRPKLVVAGASAYARHYDYPRMRQVRCGSIECERCKTMSE